MAEQVKTPRIIHSKYQYGAGLDVHNQYVTACVAAKRGHEVEKLVVQEFQRSPEGLDAMCRFLGKYLIGIIVMEATTQTPFIYDALVKYTGWGGIKPELRVVHPNLVKKYTGELHEDKHDALELATLGLAGLAKGSYVPQEKMRELRLLTREMRFVDRDCTRLKNRIKRVLTTWGLPLQDFNLSTGYATDFINAFLHAKGDFGATLDSILSGTFKTPVTTRRAIEKREPTYKVFRSIKVPNSILISLESYMLDLSFKSTIESRIEKEIESLVVQDPLIHHMVTRISKVIGLSETSAASLVAETGNVARFSNRKQFLKYVGCAPAQYISGEVSRPGHLSKRANKFARNVFTQAGRIVTHSINDDSTIKEYARKQLNAHMNNKKLVYANVGIKIARVVYAIMVKGAEFNPKFDQNVKVESSLPNRTFVMKEWRESGSQAANPKPFILKTIRDKTKHLIKYIEKNLEESTEPWLNNLSDIFDQLQ
ncbi:MAG: IS110 family transposase, partial [Candidatus Lokiarchaeota archaeon]|nr:IS110 family transposase [Candidatus Lokiarchaeota archaeon]